MIHVGLGRLNIEETTYLNYMKTYNTQVVDNICFVAGSGRDFSLGQSGGRGYWLGFKEGSEWVEKVDIPNSAFWMIPCSE